MKPEKTQVALRGDRPAATRQPESDISERAVEQALAELGMSALLSDLVTRAQSIKDAIVRSGPQPAGDSLC